MSQDIEGAIAYLKQAPDETISVLLHVSQTLVRVADFGADRPLDYLEPFSYILKEERQSAETQHAEEVMNLHQVLGPDFVAAADNRNRLVASLFARGKLTAEGEEEEEDKKEEPEGTEDATDEGEEPKHQEEETLNEGEVPNLAGDLKFICDTGLGFSEREGILLEKSIQKLVRTKPLSTARFWGKVQGVERDYYVCEVEFNDGERPHAEAGEEEEKLEEPIPEAPVEEDTGPNTFSYFVCTALGGKWSLLPDTKPKQIVASRSIRQLFTGNLDAEVIAPPGRFAGTEKDLLRAFIARVTHSCTVCPKGQYNPEEEPEEDRPLESNANIVLDEDWTPKKINSFDNFLHRLPCILPQGRTEFWAPEAEEEERERPVERGPPILRPVTQDELLEGFIPSWSFRVVTCNEKKYWLRSNAWPGLNIISSETGDRIVRIYLGWGVKATAPLEWPPLPEPKKKVVVLEEEEEEEEEKKGEEEDGGGEVKEGEGTGTKGGDSEGTYDTYEGSNYDD
jgi:radial spoke head protein 4A